MASRLTKMIKIKKNTWVVEGKFYSEFNWKATTYFLASNFFLCVLHNVPYSETFELVTGSKEPVPKILISIFKGIYLQ